MSATDALPDAPVELSLAAPPGLPDISGEPRNAMDPWSIAEWFRGENARPPLQNQLAKLNLHRDTGLWSNGTPFLGPADHFSFLPTKPWQGNAVPDYIVPTRYLGAFDPQKPRPWTWGWTVGIHGNKDVWDLASVGALSGRAAPVADGNCPAGTKLIGTFGALIGKLANDEVRLFSGAAAAGDYDVCELPKRLATAGTVTLTNDNVYVIPFGSTLIGDGDGMGSTGGVAVTLKIEPGTLVYGKLNASLIITRGARIHAVGDVDNPIVMTSEQQLVDRFDGDPRTDPEGARFAWGGLLLGGRARDSRCPQASDARCDVMLEGGVPYTYVGGQRDDDDSGTLRHVISRNGGSAPLDWEVSGFTFHGVGWGTRIEYIQSHRSSDDGVDLVGGSVSVAHVALTDNADDSFDWSHGWTGVAQFVFIRQAKDEADRAIEADNFDPGRGGTADDPPISFPQVANVTAVGPPDDFTDMVNVGGGFLFRRGTKAQVWNTLLQGAAKNCVRVESGSFARVTDPRDPGDDLVMRNTVLDCKKSFDIK